MPEGDTVHKIAAVLRPELEGARLARVWLRERGVVDALAGALVDEVATVGKHLLVGLAPLHREALVLHVHLGMHGTWHRVTAAPPPGPARLCIDTASARFACLRAPVAELLPRAELKGHPVLARLGPDLLAPGLDLDVVVARARRRDRDSVAALLLDQTVACGLGNVYKSELLFLERLAPRTPPRALSDARLAGLYRRGSALLHANLGGWRRTTTGPVTAGAPWPLSAPRLWVYDRAGQPCLRCRAPIAVERERGSARSTFWCPRCQADGSSR